MIYIRKSFYSMRYLHILLSSIKILWVYECFIITLFCLHTKERIIIYKWFQVAKILCIWNYYIIKRNHLDFNRYLTAEFLKTFIRQKHFVSHNSRQEVHCLFSSRVLAVSCHLVNINYEIFSRFSDSNYLIEFPSNWPNNCIIWKLADGLGSLSFWTLFCKTYAF